FDAGVTLARGVQDGIPVGAGQLLFDDVAKGCLHRRLEDLALARLPSLLLDGDTHLVLMGGDRVRTRLGTDGRHAVEQLLMELRVLLYLVLELAQYLPVHFDVHGWGHVSVARRPRATRSAKGDQAARNRQGPRPSIAVHCTLL